tara:strand:- start:148 stop:408 length:261 start_codon:yes stop_codon:yes gene_type:complete
MIYFIIYGVVALAILYVCQVFHHKEGNPHSVITDAFLPLALFWPVFLFAGVVFFSLYLVWQGISALFKARMLYWMTPKAMSERFTK